MNWFFIALLAPALWSVTNHIDKYLIEKYFKGVGTGSLMIFSSLIGIFVLPFILIFEPNILNISVFQALLIIGSSIVSLMGILFYLYALKRDEASIVVALFQTIPIFAYFLGFLVLKETLTLKQIVASLLIIFGAISMSLDLTERKPKLKTAVFVLMFLSSFLLALGSLIFKFVAIQTNFWITAFWEYVGAVLMGIFLLIFIKNYRTQFLSYIRINRLPMLGLNGLNEVLNVVASLSMRFATLLAPLALVLVVNGFQPLFVFTYGIILTLFFPHLGTESLVKKHLVQKIASIVIIFIGTYFLNG